MWRDSAGGNWGLPRALRDDAPGSQPSLLESNVDQLDAAKMKHFRLLPDQIRPIAPGIGGCFASDMIPVDGEPVRYMYREPARGDWDSGWRFFSGVESQEYVDNADNVAIYDVNTIANYDPSIVQFLDEPVGTAFEKSANGEFCRVPFPIDPDAN